MTPSSTHCRASPHGRDHPRSIFRFQSTSSRSCRAAAVCRFRPSTIPRRNPPSIHLRPCFHRGENPRRPIFILVQTLCRTVASRAVFIYAGKLPRRRQWRTTAPASSLAGSPLPSPSSNLDRPSWIRRPRAPRTLVGHFVKETPESCEIEPAVLGRIQKSDFCDLF